MVEKIVVENDATFGKSEVRGGTLAGYRGFQLADRVLDLYADRVSGIGILIKRRRQFLVQLHPARNFDFTDAGPPLNQISLLALNDRKILGSDSLSILVDGEAAVLSLDGREQQAQRQQNNHDLRMTPMISFATDSGEFVSVETCSLAKA